MSSTTQPSPQFWPLISCVVVSADRPLYGRGLRATVAEARAAFADEHVHMLLLTDNGRLLGTLIARDLPASGGDVPASGYATLDGHIVPPHLSAEDARRLLLTRGQRRRAVIDNSGRLLMLLCLKRRHTGFCSDDDVAARALDAH
jgi:CBS domain-containing protein